MQLKPGDKLGQYEIVSLLGRGGMGEVWKAHDPKLGRDVAIKVSARQFTDRFEREARAIGGLNHPNVCTLYHVGPNYLVLEYVEGPTLAERIKEGPIPLEEALGYARQIALALEAAHEKPLVHRDLKPANIKIKPDGSVKVLDFGLAKAAEEFQVTSDSPTELTIPGMIMGTAPYMAPEQARGKKDVDKRADIWAFAVVLYEMLTGKRLFQGEDFSDILASVIKEQPNLDGVPPQVLPLMKRCLEKDPRKRLRDIGDWELLLVGKESVTAPSQSRLGMGRGWIAAAAALAITAVIALWAPWRATQPVDRPLVRLDVDLGADVSLPVPVPILGSVFISPDGTRLLYMSGTPASLFIRRLDQPKAVELPGTQGASRPFFSPDGQWVGFSTDKLNKISVEGGAVVPLGEPALAGASWAEDGSIFVSTPYQVGIRRIPPGGGPPAAVADLASGERALSSPQVLPGGKAILFAAGHGGDVDRNTIEVLTLADHRRKVVARGGESPRYLPSPGSRSGGTGYLVYVNKSTLFAVPFDPEKLETRGTAVPVLNDIAYDTGPATGDFAFSEAPSGHGTLIYRRAAGGAVEGAMTLQWVDAAGKKEPLLAKPGIYASPVVSPDGKRIALAVSGGPDIWVYDPQRDSMTRLTFGGVYTNPAWSPDGQHVVFEAPSKGIFQARADGAGQPQALTQSKANQVPWSFTPDGKRLAWFDNSSVTYQIWTAPLEEQGDQLKAGKPEQFLKSAFTDIAPSFSSDGRWLAYQSNESGKNEVYVRAFPPPAPDSGGGQGGKWQVSNNGGNHPRWSRSGHDLMYQAGDQIMAASYTVKGDAFLAEKPRVWIAKLGAARTEVPRAPGNGMWDLSPDGKRVVVVTPVESPDRPAAAPRREHEIVMLQNFFDELRRKVPVGK